MAECAQLEQFDEELYKVSGEWPIKCNGSYKRVQKDIMAECGQLEQFDEELYKVSGEWASKRSG